MKQKTGIMFNLFVVLSLLLGMVATSALAASTGNTQSAPAAPLAQEDATAKIDPQVLQEIKESGETEFFVWMREKADLSPAANLKTKQEKGQFVFDTLRETAERTQKDLRATLDAQGVQYQPFYIANKIFVRSGGEALAFELAARPDVAQITPNQKYQLQEPFKNTDVPESPEAIETNITFIKAPDVWAMGITGQGTVMAGNDTGLDWDHPAIINKYRGWDGAVANHNYNWWDATSTYPSVPDDGHGHGTHTTGTMIGDDGGTNQIGVAPGAQTIHCKNMTDGGGGDDVTFSTCFQWDLAPWDLSGANPLPSMAPDAVNNSWGYRYGGEAQFEDEVNALQAAGIVVEVSAGNEGPSCTTLRSPGDYQQVMTTGSVNHAAPFPGSLTGFSSRGPSSLYLGDYMPDVMAPGENIRSSLPGGIYVSWDGTSMAGPHATALVGLMWAANPALKGQVDLTYQIIQETAEPLTGVTGSNCGGDYTTGPNNDWGFGTINALAAVEAAIALGGAGFLEGTVTNSATTDPLAGVSIVATKSPTQTYSTVTNAFGYYGKYLLEGTYEVNASKFGFIPESVPGVVITENMTEKLDFALDPAPSATIYGYVYDSTTGWPLYTQITVAGVPDGPFWNDPVTGYYEVTLPIDDSYDFHIEAWVAGYQPYDVTITVNNDTEENFYLDADQVACVAPGYVLVGGFNQPFNTTEPPPAWTVVNNGGACTWAFDNPGGRANLTGGTGNFAVADSDACGFGTTMNTALYSPIVDVSGLPSVPFEFKYDYNNLSTGEIAAVDVSADGGATWTNLFSWNTDHYGPATYSQDLTGLLGGSTQAQVRWRYVALGWDWWWEVDDAKLGESECIPPTTGDLVVGNVYDGNTLDALTGAVVANQAGFSFTTLATADPAVGDAFYTLFSPQGTQVFTATHTAAYGVDVQPVAVAGDSTVGQDFFLPAAFVSVDPVALNVEVLLGETLTENLTLTNSGGLATEFEIGEQPAPTATREITRIPAGSPADARRAPDLVGRSTPIRVANPADTLLTEGFEGGVMPPAGWSVIVNNAFTWDIATSQPHGGTYYGDIVYDPALVPQDEWVVSPEFVLAEGTVTLWSYGSLYWCRDTYDNCDLNVWLVVDEVGGGDDIYVGTADGDWPASWTYAQSVFDLTPLLPSSPIRLGFQYEGVDGAEVALDDIVLEGVIGNLDVPWLSESTITGTLGAGSSVAIDVTFDSAGLTAGTYTALLKIKTDAPIGGNINVPVTMNVVTPEYGVGAMLEDDSLSGAPGETVTYTVMVTNTGNVPDVFDVAVSDADWVTNAPPTLALGASESTTVEVTVEIPADAADGDWDDATCTFTSQGDPTKSAAATMTTAVDVPFGYGVELAPATNAKGGTPGSMVAYVLQLTNTGDITDTFDLAVASVVGWAVDLSATEVTLGAGETAELVVQVTIPADAAEGDSQLATVSATSQGDDSKFAASELTTTMVFPQIFLPVIPQGFTAP